MKLIDRYVYAVTQYLPEGSREDISKELRSNIEDMLPEEPTEDEVYKVLKELGNPWMLANEYKPKKQYLIGPGLYDQYLYTLKLVVGICIAVFVALSVIAGGVESAKDGITVGDYSHIFSGLISAITEGALQGAFWVSLVFVIIERSGVEKGSLPFFKKEWTPEDLPVLPVPKNRLISRVEIIVSICFTVFFTAIIYFQPELIAIYEKGGSHTNIIPLFNVDRIQVFLPFILLVALLSLGISIWKYIQGSWNISIAIGNTVYNLLSGILLTVFASDKEIFNKEFFSAIAGYSGNPTWNIETWRTGGVWVFITVLIIICLWDSVAGFLKCRNPK